MSRSWKVVLLVLDCRSGGDGMVLVRDRRWRACIRCILCIPSSGTVRFDLLT